MWCKHNVVYAVDLFSGVFLLPRPDSIPDGYNYPTKYPTKGCACDDVNRVKTQACVDRFLAGRRPGQGWSEAEIIEMVDCFRQPPKD